MYILRYSAESAKIFVGVFSILSSGLHRNRLIIVITTLANKARIIEVETAVFTSFIFLEPKRLEITTEQPIFVPSANAIIIMVMGYEALTAASASSPAYLPAITLSAML